MNYFKFYNLKPSLIIDLNDLKKRYYQKSLEVHPDHNLNNDAEEMGSYNNAAYSTLKDKWLRLKYYYELNHGPILDNIQLPQEFLLEMMELHEGLMMQDEKALEKVTQFENELETEYNSISKEIDANKNLQEELLNLYLKYRYLKRLKENI